MLQDDRFPDLTAGIENCIWLSPEPNLYDMRNTFTLTEHVFD